MIQYDDDQWWFGHLSIDPLSPASYHNQLSAGIRSCLLQPVCPISAPLPTVRALAAWLGINFNTVARVYRALEAEGLLFTRVGIGTFIYPSAATQLPQMPNESPDVDSQLTLFLSWATTNNIAIESLWEKYQTFRQRDGKQTRIQRTTIRKRNRKRNHIDYSD